MIVTIFNDNNIDAFTDFNQHVNNGWAIWFTSLNLENAIKSIKIEYNTITEYNDYIIGHRINCSNQFCFKFWDTVTRKFMKLESPWKVGLI